MSTQCSKCDAQAVYLRRYTNEYLCETCLKETTIHRVRRTINKHQMFKRDDRIVVAISGGKDSAFLLDVLYNIEKNYPNVTLIPLTIDEGIRGYRDKALEAAQEQASSLGLELEIHSFKDTLGYSLDEIVSLRDENGALGACSYCGVFRRKALNQAAINLEADVVATGHILDDEAQTIMMNMMRGDSRRIVRSNRPRNKPIEGLVPRVKPIIEMTERDVVAYAYHHKLPYHDVPCPYAEEAYRSDIRLFLNEMEHKRPGTLLAILRSGEEIVRAFEQTPTDAEIRQCEVCGTITPKKICKACSLLAELSKTD